MIGHFLFHTALILVVAVLSLFLGYEWRKADEKHMEGYRREMHRRERIRSR